MKAEEIIRLILNPSTLDENTSEQLKVLQEDYPYFQTAHLLYLMNLQTQKDSDFNPELKKTACYVADHRKFFLLINEKQFAPIRLDRLERQDSPVSMESNFELIDFFLSEKWSRSENENTHLKKTEPEYSSQKGLISTDYMSYAVPKDLADADLNIAPMPHQERIDEFLKQDAAEPVKIQLKELKEDIDPEIPGIDQVDIDDFFSETLAKIYLKQKKYDKALEIIRKLHLVYPEKNIYFADQIRFLEKLITNIKKI